MLSNDVCSDHVRCIGLSGLSCLQASRPLQPLIFRAVRRPVISGSLGRFVCSLIDGLSVWNNYPRPDWEGGDFVACYVCTKVHNKPKILMCKVLSPCRGWSFFSKGLLACPKCQMNISSRWPTTKAWLYHLVRSLVFLCLSRFKQQIVSSPLVPSMIMHFLFPYNQIF